jgi:hypothetical protein
VDRKTMTKGMQMYRNSGESSIPLNNVSHLVCFNAKNSVIFGVRSFSCVCHGA